MLVKNKQIDVGFRQVRMFGTMFNYKGYGLDLIENKVVGSCVPEYLLSTYNNQEEINPRKK